MKPLGPYSVRSVIIRPWIMYALASFMLVSICLPLFFDTKYVECVVQLIMWIVNVLVFLFLIVAVTKDNIEINRNDSGSISWFDYFVTIVSFFMILIFVPMFGNFDRFVEVMSSFVHVM